MLEESPIDKKAIRTMRGDILHLQKETGKKKLEPAEVFEMRAEKEKNRKKEDERRKKIEEGIKEKSDQKIKQEEEELLRIRKAERLREIEEEKRKKTEVKDQPKADHPDVGTSAPATVPPLTPPAPIQAPVPAPTPPDGIANPSFNSGNVQFLLDLYAIADNISSSVITTNFKFG